MTQRRQVGATSNLALEPYQIIIRPILTEKGVMTSENNTYTFEVHKLATKTQIKDAIENLYDVKVVSVNTQNRQGKKRRTRAGIGVARSWKKAMVKLDKEHVLNLY